MISTIPALVEIDLKNAANSFLSRALSPSSFASFRDANESELLSKFQ